MVASIVVHRSPVRQQGPIEINSCRKVATLGSVASAVAVAVCAHDASLGELLARNSQLDHA